MEYKLSVLDLIAQVGRKKMNVNHEQIRFDLLQESEMNLNMIWA